VDYRLLGELLKNANKGDLELAKALGTSQPTVIRSRNRLIKERMTREFTIIPDFSEKGNEVQARS